MAKNIVFEIFSEKKVLLLLLLTLGAITFLFATGGPFNGGLKFGIEFSGGLRIPVLLEQAVEPNIMREMVKNIETRAATFGLSEVKVTPVGDTQIYVEVSKTNPQLVSDIRRILSQQGVYQGIVDGKVAVGGENIYPDTVRQESPSYYSGSDWVVAFSLRTEGQEHFIKTVRGKGNYPLYMYLDRPNDAIIVISREDLLKHQISESGYDFNLSESEAIKIAINALNLENTQLPIYLQEELPYQLEEEGLTPATNSTKAIISEDAPQELKDKLTSLGFALSEKTSLAMQPIYGSAGAGLGTIINRWDAVGLKSAPTLNPALTEGAPSVSYVITGSSRGKGQERAINADIEAREIMSVLKGGALPVQISLGSVQEVPAKFGQEVLRLSLLGLVFAILVISIFVAFLYRTPAVVLPIVLTSVSEIILLTTIIGYFTIDLAAMAGIIAAVGVSVDAQIIITDEIIKRREGEDAQHLLDNAFHIIMTNATVAIVAMAPLLLFSGLVQIIGFATVTVIGYILGVAISRPAYAVVAKKLFGIKKISHEPPQQPEPAAFGA
ncbi:hypothetical protein COU37_01155 [Candidatus Micrarchaeota archaeon CG10_big_fil_rev_8_21_14_0_10_45_29]|nr:MAG: hypothetical protein COU37_01155 [Candidatus Micrarchaeota archaeon CG10_big_fil_rev_8_21_14_0_10_45_29]